MFPEVAEHRGWRIERRPPGFEFTPGLLGKITTFVAHPPAGGPTIFAFMYSFLLTDGPSQQEEELGRHALAVIVKAIDGGLAGDGLDHTFELAPDGWTPVANPAWWIPVRRTG